MPEYLALMHFHNLTDAEAQEDPPAPEDINAAFRRMERAGIVSLH